MQAFRKAVEAADAEAMAACLADDVVFTVEYSVRAAQTAVYQLMGVDRPIPAVTRHDHAPSVLLHTIGKAIA